MLGTANLRDAIGLLLQLKMHANQDLRNDSKGDLHQAQNGNHGSECRERAGQLRMHTLRPQPNGRAGENQSQEEKQCPASQRNRSA